MSTDHRVCENCVYYDFSLCKRYPPVPLFLPQGKDIVGAFQPTVATDDWCGEFDDGRTA
jgi:hypothetical protein